MPLKAGGRLIVDVQHILFAASDLGVQLGGGRGLDHMPVNLVLGLPAVELGAGQSPELGEVELVVLPLVPKGTQQLPVQRQAEDLGPAAADVKDAVFQPPAGFPADQIVGAEPDPGTGKIAAPVFVRIAVAGLRTDPVFHTVERNLTGEGGLHALRMPEHLKGVQIPEKLAGSIAYMKGHLLLDIQIPGNAAGVAHPLGMGRRLRRRDGNAAGGVRLAAKTVRRADFKGRVCVDAYILPGKEPVQLPVLLPPEAGVYHQVGGLLPAAKLLRQMPDQAGGIPGQSRIAGEELHIEGLGLAGLRVFCGKGMPPPVIAAFGQWPSQHPLVSAEIADIGHVCSLLFWTLQKNTDGYKTMFCIVTLYHKASTGDSLFAKDKGPEAWPCLRSPQNAWGVTHPRQEKTGPPDRPGTAGILRRPE